MTIRALGADDPTPAGLLSAQKALDRAREHIEKALDECRKANSALEFEGRETDAAAAEMICASLEQSARDAGKWARLVTNTRNGEAGR